jgi:hypothetical protein
MATTKFQSINAVIYLTDKTLLFLRKQWGILPISPPIILSRSQGQRNEILVISFTERKW